MAADDVHLFEDLVAVIHAPPEPFAPGAILLTTLRPGTALVLLNVSLGDRASIERRRCGCAVETLGWPTHLSAIRSHEKLTAGGMTFLDTDVIRILEEVLPTRCGGGPTDYQLVEEESADGLPRVRILVDPAIGAVAMERVVTTFLDTLASGSPSARVMVEEWRRAGLPRVERRAPLVTSGGKILHLVAAPRLPGGSRSPPTSTARSRAITPCRRTPPRRAASPRNRPARGSRESQSGHDVKPCRRGHKRLAGQIASALGPGTWDTRRQMGCRSVAVRA